MAVWNRINSGRMTEANPAHGGELLDLGFGEAHAQPQVRRESVPERPNPARVGHPAIRGQTPSTQRPIDEVGDTSPDRLELPA